MSASNSDTPRTQDELQAKLEAEPGDWESRKALAHLLYNQGQTIEAADLVWGAPEIPSIDLELGFAVKILGKGRPSRAIRLLAEIQKLNQGKAAQNLGLANALLHHGMVMQAARFYGAAIEIDPEIANADQEHFLLWVDDREKLWGDFEEERPQLEQLPWIKRDAEQAAQLRRSMRGHTTPISVPGLKRALAEQATHQMYVQSEHLGGNVSPPPAVTIPMDRVEPKDLVIDNERGAGQPMTAEEASGAASPVSKSMGVALPGASTPKQVVPPPVPLTPHTEGPVGPATPVPAASDKTMPIAGMRPPQPVLPGAASVPPTVPVPAPLQAAPGTPNDPDKTIPVVLVQDPTNPGSAPAPGPPTPPPGAPAPAPTMPIELPPKTELTEDGKLRVPKQQD